MILVDFAKKKAVVLIAVKTFEKPFHSVGF
jgi:hypothetical protein